MTSNHPGNEPAHVLTKPRATPGQSPETSEAITAILTLLASARPDLEKYEQAADTLIGLLTYLHGVPGVRVARGTVLVAKQAIHLCRLAVMEVGEAVERVVAVQAGRGG